MNEPAQKCSSLNVRRWEVPAICLGLAAITFAVFGQTLTHGFINYDDDSYVYANPVVTGGLTLKGIVWIFTHGSYSLYHPLTMLSLMADHQVYGLHAGGYHLTNVLLHTASGILLFLILRQMTGALWRSGFVAAVFAIHPLRVESVAWVAERKDVLSVFFFMLTLAAYVRYVRKPHSLGRYLTMAALFVLALLSKPTVVTLPFVLLLLDYWPLQRTESRKLSVLVLEKIPLLALAAGTCAITVLTAEKLVASYAHVSMPLRISNAVVSYAVYLRQMIWPEGLAVLYPFPRNGVPGWDVALAGALLVAFSAIAWSERRKQPWLLTGWFWYLVMLLPMIGIVQVGLFSHSDRYTYLSQIGLYVAITWWAAESRVSRAALAGLMTGALVMLMVCAWKQTASWKSSETVWVQALASTTGNYVAQGNFGNVLILQRRLDEAMVHYQEALKINPDYAESRDNIGNVFLVKGQMDEAIANYQKALKIRPDFAEAHFGMATALQQKGRTNEAIDHFQRTVEINPEFAEAQVNLANLLLATGRLDEAMVHYQMALTVNTNNADAHNNLGFCFFQRGRMREAFSQYQEALQIQPSNPSAQNNLAWLLATCPDASLRNGVKAVGLALQADAVNGGGNAPVLRTLAAAYAEAGRFSEAADTAQRALHLAGEQSNAKLVGQLQSELKLYQAGSPFHETETKKDDK
jgi:tetratricopeptide (TPR) repeat protein